MAFPVEPMKAVLGTLPPATEDDHWAYEIKWDGHRTLVHVRDGRVRLQSSNGNDVTEKYPELAGLPGSLHAASAVLDGELVVLDDAGRPDFGLIQRHERQAVFQAFDILELAGVDTTGLPYEDRRRLLATAFEPGPNWQVPAHRVGDGAALLAATAAQGLEGIMAKRLGSRYVVGKRSPNWRKVKNRITAELVIGGWSPGTGSRSSTFGALLVGVREADGRLRYAGGVGTGFTQAVLESLHSQLSTLTRPECPFDPVPPPIVSRTARWVRPELSATVEFAEWTNDGVVRHASFVGLA